VAPGKGHISEKYLQDFGERRQVHSKRMLRGKCHALEDDDREALLLSRLPIREKTKDDISIRTLHYWCC